MEIERKFLVDRKLWESLEKPVGKDIKQGYFISNKQFSVRVRTKGTKGFFTVKGTLEGIARDEYEYEIPFNDAIEMLQKYAKPYLKKTRYEIEFAGKTWEIDEFHGSLSPLVLAEVELESVDEEVQLPDWVMNEVSTDPYYFNSEIVKRL